MNNDKHNRQPLIEPQGAMSERLESAKERVLHSLNEAQEKTREVADKISDGTEEAMHKMADTVTSGGEYLHRQGDEIHSNLTKFVRKHPYLSLAAAFALGAIVVIATSPRR